MRAKCLSAYARLRGGNVLRVAVWTVSGAASCRVVTVNPAAVRGRLAYDERAWRDAHDAFSQASAEGPLDADDVERMGFSATLTWHDSGGEAFERLHQLRLDAGEPLRAARAAFWAAMSLFPRGEG